jgi:hypothetical protein
MSANVYSVPALLVGKNYVSRSTRGTITHAEMDNRAVWYEDCESFLVQLDNGKWRTIAVKQMGL